MGMAKVAPGLWIAIGVFTGAILLFLISEALIKRRSQGLARESKDGGSLRAIKRCRDTAFLLGILSAIFPLLRLPGARDQQIFAGAGLVFLGTLIREIRAWESDRNHRATTVNWQFTTADARVKLKRLYPTY